MLQQASFPFTPSESRFLIQFLYFAEVFGLFHMMPSLFLTFLFIYFIFILLFVSCHLNSLQFCLMFFFTTDTFE